MATERVKVYEDGKRGGLPVWAWLLPLLLILALLAWFFLHHGTANQSATDTAAPATQATTSTSTGPGTALPTIAAVHFATDSAELTPDDQSALTRAADYMKQHPEAHMRLEGYTDSTGSDSHNLTLSQRRSQSVAAFLKSQGIEGSRLTGEGFGPSSPVDTNATAGGKADNRRVELFQQQ